MPCWSISPFAGVAECCKKTQSIVNYQRGDQNATYVVNVGTFLVYIPSLMGTINDLSYFEEPPLSTNLMWRSDYKAHFTYYTLLTTPLLITSPHYWSSIISWSWNVGAAKVDLKWSGGMTFTRFVFNPMTAALLKQSGSLKKGSTKRWIHSGNLT